MNNLEILFNLLIRPNYALKRTDKTLSLSIMVVIAALWSSTVGSYLIKGVSVNTSMFLFNIIVPIIVKLCLIIMLVSIWHFICESFKGEGKATELFPCICLSLLPYIFLAPMALILKFSGINVTFLWIFFNFLILVWVIALQISSLKIVYEINGPAATLTYFIPFAVVFVLSILILILVISFFFITASQALTPFLEL